MINRRFLAIAASASIAFAGCASAAASTAPATSPTSAGSKAAATAAPPAVKFIFEGAGQFEVISPTGVRVIIDPTDSSLLTTPATAADILVLTQGHHIDSSFVSTFPGKVVNMKATVTTAGDVTIIGVAAMGSDDPIDTTNPTDVLNVVETGGVRIAFFGEVGQLALTPGQLSALGRVDVLASALVSPHAGMTATNKKGINIAKQVATKIFVPTYTDPDTAKLAAAQWAGCFSTNSTLSLSTASLPAKAAVVFMGDLASSFGTLLPVPACSI